MVVDLLLSPEPQAAAKHYCSCGGQSSLVFVIQRFEVFKGTVNVC